MDTQKFLEIAARLKSVKRTGWVERGVEGAESVADHSWMMALMCMVLPFEGDRDKAVKMALVHDIAEAEVGDIITKENWPAKGTMNEKDKTSLERKAIKKLASLLDAETAKEVQSLWDEFEEGKTREASFVRDIDIAECLIQAYRYHKAGNFRKPLEGFWDERTIGWIKSESIKTLVRKVIGSGW